MKKKKRFCKGFLLRVQYGTPEREDACRRTGGRRAAAEAFASTNQGWKGPHQRSRSGTDARRWKTDDNDRVEADRETKERVASTGLVTSLNNIELRQSKSGWSLPAFLYYFLDNSHYFCFQSLSTWYIQEERFVLGKFRTGLIASRQVRWRRCSFLQSCFGQVSPWNAVLAVLHRRAADHWRMTHVWVMSKKSQRNL